MKQSEEYRSRHSMEVPGKSTEVPGGCTEVPDNCQELPWSRKKSLYGCHENAAWQQLTKKPSDSHGGTWVWVPVFMAIFLLYS